MVGERGGRRSRSRGEPGVRLDFEQPTESVGTAASPPPETASSVEQASVVESGNSLRPRLRGKIDLTGGGRRRPPPGARQGPPEITLPSRVNPLFGPREAVACQASRSLAGPWPWSCAGAVLGRRWPRRSTSCHRGERCRRRSPRGPRAADSARGATTCSSGRNRWASSARRQRWRPEDHRWHHCGGGVTRPGERTAVARKRWRRRWR